MSGMIRSMPGRSSPANDTPRSTAIQVRLPPVAEAVEREIHADLADAAERREHEFAWRPSGALPARERNTSPAVIASSCAVRQAQHQAARLVERLERAGELAIRRGAPRMSPPMPGRTREPVGADRRKARAAIPLREPRDHRAATARANSVSGVTATPCGRKIGRRIGVPAGWCAQLTPMPDDGRGLAADALAFDQDAGELGAVEQQIVRPFQRELAAQAPARPSRDRVVHRQRRHEGQFAADAPPAPASVSSRLA